ncbi:hypothetical protein Hanom_Chr06g00541531 [Helianthus anomalus]
MSLGFSEYDCSYEHTHVWELTNKIDQKAPKVMSQPGQQPNIIFLQSAFVRLCCSTTSMIYSFNWLPKVLVENDVATWARAFDPILSANEGSFKNLAMANEKLCGDGSHKNPVSPSFTLSTGPPLLHAITGLWAAIASSGTIPKCSS